MVDTLRRLLWLVPLVVLSTLGLFFVFNQVPAVAEKADLPLFYNPSPTSAELRAEALLVAVRGGDAGAARDLAALGGAGLPIILPRLALLSVKERRLVAQALWPLAVRMGLAERSSPLSKIGPQTFSEDEQLFVWQRFYRDHDLDFRKVAAARLVRRLGERKLSLRTSDLQLLDTYALPFLVAQLGRVTSDRDVVRVRRLVPAIAHATGEPFSLPEAASPEQARLLATQIRAYWDRSGPRFTSLDRFETLAARLSQTAFWIWASRTARAVVRLDAPLLANRLSDKANITLSWMLFGILGALVIGPAGAGFIQIRGLRRPILSGAGGASRLWFGGALAAVVPGALVRAPESPYLAALLCSLAGALSSAYVLEREVHSRLNWRVHYVLKKRKAAQQIAAIARWLLPSVPTLAPILLVELVLWVTCIELSNQTDGLLWATLEAYQRGDLDWLMAVSLGGGLMTAGVQLVADAFLGTGKSTIGDS